MLIAWTAMSSHAITVTDTIFNRYAHEDFAFGADVSSGGRSGSTRTDGRRTSYRF